ncbi:jg27941, partial [Pararge aegeria aegeria]
MLVDNIKVFSDQTLNQQANFKKLKEELEQRQKNGENSIGKFDELKCILHSFHTQIQFIVITETWIKSKDEAKRLLLPGYTHYYNYRENTKGGGVSIFAHDNLKHNITEELCIAGMHYLWIHVSDYCLDIGVIYNPDRTNIKSFLETYSSQLQKRKRVIVFGDYNLDLLRSDRMTMDYKEMLKENGFSLLNKVEAKYCTRETSTTKTLLDHASTNLKSHVFHMAVIESSISDHKQLYLEVEKYKPVTKKKIEYEALDYKMLFKRVEKEMEGNITNFSDLETILTNSIKTSKIKKTKILNPPRNDWINKNILIDIDKRNALWHQHKMSPKDDQIKHDFLKQRNAVTEKIQKVKREYYIKAFKECTKKPMKMWNLLNSLSNNKIKEICSPTKLNIVNDTITNPQRICESFNNYFSTVGSTLANSIPIKYHQNETYTLPNQRCSDAGLSQMSPVTLTEVSKLIDDLNTNTALGIDGVSSKAIKCIKNVLAEKLTICINHCFDQGLFPDTLKVAKVSPIFKSGSKSDPGNYRPISVLPVLSKIFEKAIYSRLIQYLNSINFLYEKQYGFRSKSSTISAAIDLVTNMKLQIDKKQIVVGIFIDLKKAFDTVSHNLLLNKLNSIGIN